MDDVQTVSRKYHLEKKKTKQRERMSARELECPGREMLTCM